ncbi:hypothetical protein PENTCL1PPCAC_319, partial [Pristionchus entomophagus]
SKKCSYASLCKWIHPNDPEYPACLKSMDADLVPIDEMTVDDRYETYVEAVVSPILQPQPRGLPTHLPNGRTTDLKEMALANGCTEAAWVKLTEQIPLFYADYLRLDPMIKAWYRNTPRPQLSAEIDHARREYDQVKKKLINIIKMRNSYHNSDVLDLHGAMDEEHAELLLSERFSEIERDPTILPMGSRRPRTLTVITGAGNNSIGGDPLVRDTVDAFLKQLGYRNEPLNEGCVIVHLPSDWFSLA